MSKHLDVVWTNQFKKDYKLAMNRHLDIDLLDDIIRKLASSEQLPEKNKDHALTGNWVGHRECHIQPDWLLVYRIENDLLVLTLSRTGTHSVKSLYFVSVHPMQKQQKLDIRLPPDAYAETHNMLLYLKYAVKNALSFSNGMMSI